MGRYLVEKYLPVTAGDLLGEEAERLNAASAGGARLLWTMYSPEEETCFFLFDAPAPAVVQATACVAGVGLDRMTAVVEVPPSPERGSRAYARLT